MIYLLNRFSYIVTNNKSLLYAVFIHMLFRYTLTSWMFYFQAHVHFLRMRALSEAGEFTATLENDEPGAN